MPIETNFDVGFVARLTAEEKQIQQNYRPIIGVHKWFARRPGALFRSLLLTEFDASELTDSYFKAHDLSGVTVADPFMGGGTTLFEANRLGCRVLGFDINPMAFWVVRQELQALDRDAFRGAAAEVVADVDLEVNELYTTGCTQCDQPAPVKYFLWVKQQRCGGCARDLDLFPGYLIAGNERHPNFVLHCPECRRLVELADLPAKDAPVLCPLCRYSFDYRKGTAARNTYACHACGHRGRYPAELRAEGPPRHRLFGMEYHCYHCRAGHSGRFFKTADAADQARVDRAASLLSAHGELSFPPDAIPDGDETRRLHRWGYGRYREMFNERQLLTLGLLLQRIRAVEPAGARHALATVFSDSLRYQNMLCRYDTYALKCQDIFSVHGFPVGLIQCENNVLGIPGIGSGSFRHFVEKYDRAKAYCEAPFETQKNGRTKRLRPMAPERIEATLVRSVAELNGSRSGLLVAGSLEDAPLEPASLDAVFTDPPYFDNVQYAELMDFCYAWLRLLLADEFQEFRGNSTRSARELTGNNTTGKDLVHFTEGLSRVFRRASAALKPAAPFVFTYHHNKLEAYIPVVVAVLDAGLRCTAALPCPAEMTASLHINGTGSSVMDTILVCRRETTPEQAAPPCPKRLGSWLSRDREALARGGVPCSRGDLYCLALGHMARAAVAALSPDWDAELPLTARMIRVEQTLRHLVERASLELVVGQLLGTTVPEVSTRSGEQRQPSLFD